MRRMIWIMMGDDDEEEGGEEEGEEEEGDDYHYQKSLPSTDYNYCSWCYYKHIYIYCKSNTTISNAKIRRPANVNRCDTDGDSDDDDEYRGDENDDVTMMLIVSSLTVMPTITIRIPMFSIVLHCLLYPILSQVVPMQICFQ